MAVKSLLGRNIKELTNTMADAISYVDIDYDVRRPENNKWTTKTRSLICYNDYAVLNAYRLWLQSRRYDYIRAPNFGGFFDNNLNDKVSFSPDNEATVSQLIINESAEKWPDIVVLDCQVTCKYAERNWHIKIIAQDKKTKMILKDENINVSIANDQFI